MVSQCALDSVEPDFRLDAVQRTGQREPHRTCAGWLSGPDLRSVERRRQHSADRGAARSSFEREGSSLYIVRLGKLAIDPAFQWTDSVSIECVGLFTESGARYLY